MEANKMSKKRQPSKATTSENIMDAPVASTGSANLKSRRSKKPSTEQENNSKIKASGTAGPSQVSSSSGKLDRGHADAAAAVRPTTTTAKLRRLKSTALSTSRKRGGPAPGPVNARATTARKELQEFVFLGGEKERRASVSSVGEAPLTPTHGDVHTLVCDYGSSPVPSDVESNFDYSVSGFTLDGGLLGQSLRPSGPGRQLMVEETAANNLGLYAAFSRDRFEEAQTCGVPRAPPTAEIQQTTVQMHKDSKTIKSVSKKSGGGSSLKRTKVPTNIEPSCSQTTITLATNTSRPSMHRNKNLMQANDQSLRSAAMTQESGAPDDDSRQKLDIRRPDASLSTRDLEPEDLEQSTVVLVVVTPAAASAIESDPPQSEKAALPPAVQAPITLENESDAKTAADKECRRAFDILNSRGFSVSLHTLRRALLTPTEYRTLTGSRPKEERSPSSMGHPNKRG